MESEARREKIMETLRREQGPVSGTELAARMGVSRQVIVQDIALLRVSYQNIISTNRGYLLYAEPAERRRCRRVVKVKHDREDIVREWRGAGLEVEEMGSFLLERYWFNLYKIS